MDTTTITARLGGYRQAVYRCLTCARAALCDRCDALATYPEARSFVALSQAPCFQRRWPRVYEALEDGRIDRPALRALFVAMAPPPAPRARRPAPDRTLVHVPAAGQVLPPHTAPVRPGWAFSTLVALPPEPSRWTHLLDNARIPSDQTALTVGAAQLAAFVPPRKAQADADADTGTGTGTDADAEEPKRPATGAAEDAEWPRLLADGSDGTAGGVAATAPLCLDQRGRAASPRVRYRAAPPPTGHAGRPRLDGTRFKGSDPATHGEPDAAWTGPAARGREGTVRCGGGLHRTECRTVPLTAVCLTRPMATDAKGDRRLHETWFWWRGGRAAPARGTGPPVLDPRRFRIEPGYRVDKQDLLWTAPPVRTPEQMERWADA